MNDFILAALLGISFGNLWICALLVFSLQNTMRYTALGYLIGRAAAILTLSVFVALLGKIAVINHTWLNFASGVFLAGFSFYLFSLHVLGWVPFWRKKPTGETPSIHSSCDGNCASCPTHTVSEYASACSDCADHGVCSAEEPEVEALTRDARKIKGKYSGDTGENNGFAAGFVLGMFRGAAMCAKLAVLLPVLLSSGVVKSMFLGLTFALTSSLYPLLGFAMGTFALKFLKYKKILFVISCSMLMIYAVFYFYKAFSVWFFTF